MIQLSTNGYWKQYVENREKSSHPPYERLNIKQHILFMYTKYVYEN